MDNSENKRTADFSAKVSGEDYKPYVSPDENVREFTVRAVIIGCILACLFGAANAYLAMKIGMTICASIPAAVIGMAVLKGFRNSSVLENNIVQTCRIIRRSSRRRCCIHTACTSADGRKCKISDYFCNRSSGRSPGVPADDTYKKVPYKGRAWQTAVS